jgi:hypothetical protein
MTKDELKALIEDLRLNHEYCPKEVILQAADELERLQQAEQEPVPYPEGDVVGPCICGSWPGGKCLKCPRITPPQRTWVGLTDEDKHEIELRAGITEDDDGYIVSQVFKLTEAKLKEKNTDAGLKTGVGKPGDFV